MDQGIYGLNCRTMGEKSGIIVLFASAKQGRINAPAPNHFSRERTAMATTNSTIFEKTCTKCGNTYPATEGYFRRDKHSPDGFTQQCKNCLLHTPSRRTLIPIGYKRCSRGSKCKHPMGCIQPKTNDFFGLSKARTDGFHNQCKACIHQKAVDTRDQKREYDKTYYEKHREQRRVKSKRYREANSERIRERHRLDYQEHRTEILERQRQKGYIKPKNPATTKVNWNRRRARKINLPDTFTLRDWERAVNYFQDSCAACGRPRGLWHTLAADHWIPLSSPMCPGTTPFNIIPLCHGIDGCNNSKGGRDATEWLVQRFGRRKAREVVKHIAEYFAWLKG